MVSLGPARHRIADGGAADVETLQTASKTGRPVHSGLCILIAFHPRGRTIWELRRPTIYELRSGEDLDRRVSRSVASIVGKERGNRFKVSRVEFGKLDFRYAALAPTR